MKKTFSMCKRLLALALVLVFLGLCGCGKKPTTYSYYEEVPVEGVEDADTDATTDTENKDTTGNKNTDKTTGKTENKNTTTQTGFDIKNVPAELKGTEIFVYSWNDMDAVSGAKSVIEKFEKQTGITVRWKTGSFDNYATEVATYVSAGDSPDVIRLKGFETSILSTMQPLSKSGYDFSDDIWDKNVLNYYSVNGKAYAANRANTLIQQPQVMYYSTAVISGAGLEDPYALFKNGQWTWSKFEEMIKAYKKANPSKEAWRTKNFFDICTMNGVNLIKRDGDRFVDNTGNKKVVSGLQQMVSLISEGVASKIDDDNGDGAAWQSGGSLFSSQSIIGARTAHWYFSKAKKESTIACVPYPSIEGQEYYQSFDEYEAYGIAEGAKNPKAVPYFLAYYLDGDNYNSKTFFPNETIMDVYKWCMSQKNIIVNDDRYILTASAGLAYRTDIGLKIAEMKNPSDVQPFVASIRSKISSATKKESNTISKDIK